MLRCCTLLLPCCVLYALEAALACPLKSEGLYPAAMALLWHFLFPRTSVSTLSALVSLPFAIIVQRTFGFGLPPTFAVLPPRATALRAAVPVDISTSFPTDNAFRLQQYRDAVELQTAAYKVTPRRRSVTGPTSSRGRDGTAQDVEIMLVSMVHLADQAYYREIMRDASSYDRVLFELIAGSDVSELDQAGNRAVTEYMYPTREQVWACTLDTFGTWYSGMSQQRRYEAVQQVRVRSVPKLGRAKALTQTSTKSRTYHITAVSSTCVRVDTGRSVDRSLQPSRRGFYVPIYRRCGN